MKEKGSRRQGKFSLCDIDVIICERRKANEKKMNRKRIRMHCNLENKISGRLIGRLRTKTANERNPAQAVIWLQYPLSSVAGREQLRENTAIDARELQ